MINIDELYRRAVSAANSVALSGVLGFGFFFVALVASDKLPIDVRWPMQLVMMVASSICALMIVSAPFLSGRKIAERDKIGERERLENQDHTSLPPPTEAMTEIGKRDWRELIRRGRINLR